MPETLNLNSAECIRQITSIGSTAYRNICTGAEAVVPWGAGEWALAIGGGAFVGAMVLMFSAMALSIITGR
jgi:hypothetical protein